MFSTISEDNETKLEKLRILYDDRVQSIKSRVELFFKELENDAVFKALKENKYSIGFSVQRASELFEVLMKSEQEATICKLQKIISGTSGKVKTLELQNEDLQGKISELEALNKEYQYSTDKISNTINTRGSELLCSELEYLKQELKIRENSYSADSQDVKKYYEDRINELETSYNSVLSQFKGYQRQTEDLSSDQQKVIKSLLEKIRKMKTKILSQRSKLEEMMKVQKATIDNYEIQLEEAEEKMQAYMKGNTEKECEINGRHRQQLSQLQGHYQELMNMKLAEMQKEVDEQVLRSQEHEQEVRNIMENRLREVEKNFWHKDLCIKKVSEKEEEVEKHFSQKIEGLKEKHEKIQEELKSCFRKTQDELEIQLKKCEELENLNKGLENSMKSTDGSLASVQRECESQLKQLQKAEKANKFLSTSLEQAKIALSSMTEQLETKKAEFNLSLLQTVEKSEYLNLQEKLFFLTKELENKSNFTQALENEIKSLGNALKDLSSHLELEKLNHQETKSQLSELQDYTSKLIQELEFYEKELKSLQFTLSDQSQEIDSLNQALDYKERDIQSFKHLALNKDSETRIKYLNKLETLKKSIKGPLFQLKSAQNDLLEYFEKEVVLFKKQFSMLSQDLSLHILSALLNYKKNFENNVEGMCNKYYNKLQVLEDNINRGEIYWNDPDTEGIRRAVKGLIETRQMVVIENRSLKESLAKLKQDNEVLYVETQDLHKKFHLTLRPSSELNSSMKSNSGILRSRLGSSYKDVFNHYN